MPTAAGSQKRLAVETARLEIEERTFYSRILTVAAEINLPRVGLTSN